MSEDDSPARGRAPLDEEDAAVIAANEAFYRALAAGDFAAIEEIWAEDRDLVCIHPGWDAIVGRDAVMASWQAIVLGGPPAIFCQGATVARRGGIAIVTCHEVVGADHGGARQNLLVATNVFVREDEQWRMFLHQAGPVAQPALFFDGLDDSSGDDDGGVADDDDDDRGGGGAGGSQWN